MSREVFEYFYDADELEPYCSELPSWAIEASSPPQSAREVVCNPCSPAQESQGDVRPAITVDAASNESTERDTVGQQTQDGSTPGAIAREDGELVEADIAKPAAPSVEARREPRIDVGTQDDSPARSRVRRFISVHALGQSAFCVRSAILAMENGEEQDIDEPLPRLTYLPNFLRERIEELLSQKLRGIGVSLLYGFSLGVFMVVGVIRQDRMLFYPAFFIGILYVYWLAITFAEIVRLVARRRAAISAEAREPDPQVNGIQAVNWWSLLKSGFEPVNYQQPFRHPELPLEGSPWRVLERGSTKIPVIHSGVEKLGAQKGELYDKHQVRLVAYALLLESMDHVEVPFGLVVPVDSPRGLAMKITPGLRERAMRFLDEFAMKLQESQQHEIEPRLPEHRNRCAGCKYGQPVPISGREIESARKAGTRVLVLQHGDGKTYHCQCGDRFGSAPPHAKSIKLGLSAALG